MKPYHCIECEFEGSTSYECFIHLIVEGHEEFVSYDLDSLYYPLSDYGRET